VSSQHATYVVIGAGQAAGRAVEAMRGEGFEGRIVVVGTEDHLPYERPPLSKQLLTGDYEPERTYLHDQAFYDEHRIELRLRTSALAIDRDARTVDLSDGESLSYDKLLLTTGARVRRLSSPGSDLPGINYLRDISDSLAIRGHFAEGARLVIVGGGYIGLEAAAAAASRGCHVTVLEMAPLVMNRVVAPDVSRFYEAVHRDHGVDIRTSATVEGFAGGDRVEAVLSGDGVSIPADFVVVGVGIEAEATLAEAAGLPIDNGIMVDEYGRTEDPAIFAAGDVANHPNPLLGRRVRLESWQNAQNQAINTARAMCGRLEPYAEIPWFWSNQYDLNLQMVGLPETWDQLVVRGDMADHRFSVFCLADGSLVAANGINSPRDVRVARMLMEQNIRPDPAALGDPDTPLKSLLSNVSTYGTI
jgi:3-phenylpropionate/trans-cinnamate dioxygenase ferredoxin reductase subunit